MSIGVADDFVRLDEIARAIGEAEEQLKALRQSYIDERHRLVKAGALAFVAGRYVRLARPVVLDEEREIELDEGGGR